MSTVQPVREERGATDRIDIEGLGIGWATTEVLFVPRSDALVRLFAFVVGIAVLIAVGLSIAVARSAAFSDVDDPESAVTSAFEARTGIRPLSVSLAAGGGLIDVRHHLESPGLVLGATAW